MQRAQVNPSGFNSAAAWPYALRPAVLQIAMEDIYEMLYNVNDALIGRGLLRLEESIRGAIYSGMLSDLLTEAVAKHSTGLTKNGFHNGHPDLIPVGRYAHDSMQSADEGVEVKTTKGRGAVDMHGARPGWYCIFRYEADYDTQPVVNRAPTRFTEILLAQLDVGDFRHNARGALGTRTASPHRQGIAKLRAGWVYRDP